MWSGHPIMLPRYFYWAVLLAICAYAWWRGRSDERLAALACFAASLVSLLVLSPWQQRYSGVELGVFVVDACALAVFARIALQSERFWPLWVSGLQLTTSMAHLIKAVDIDLLPLAYGAAARFWSYPILLIIAVGTWRGHRRNHARLADQGNPKELTAARS